MPNWQELVRQRLSGLALDAAEKDEINADSPRTWRNCMKHFARMVCRSGKH